MVCVTVLFDRQHQFYICVSTEDNLISKKGKQSCTSVVKSHKLNANVTYKHVQTWNHSAFTHVQVTINMNTHIYA